MSDASSLRLVLADIDGTLLNDEKVLTARAAAAAASLQREGVAFTLTSSRPPRGMARLIPALGLTLPIAGFNGGLLIDPSLDVLERRPLEPEVAHAAAQTIRSQGLDLWIYTETDWWVPDAEGTHVRNEAWILGFEPRVQDRSVGALLDQAFKIVGVCNDPCRVRTCQTAVKDALQGRASAETSEPHFLDITHPKATKGEVVKTLAARLGLRASEIATIGDMPNDVLMFDVSGLSIAMGNASEAVKAKASRTTASNQEEGFAKAMERLLEERREARLAAAPTGPR